VIVTLFAGGQEGVGVKELSLERVDGALTAGARGLGALELLLRLGNLALERSVGGLEIANRLLELGLLARGLVLGESDLLELLLDLANGGLLGDLGAAERERVLALELGELVGLALDFCMEEVEGSLILFWSALHLSL
jgi:hypothetical protein